LSNSHIYTYEKAGVNIPKIQSMQRIIGKMISESYSFQKIGKITAGFGHYSGLITLGNNVLALHTDGVGTKVLVAQQMKCYDTIGIDCIAMNVNDIICTGAQPFA
jgi:phosphoribosylformylglycinamidine cyclo-ligase